MRCDKCGSESPSEKKFCGDCGAALTRTAVEAGPEPGVYYCARHKKEQTRVTCGRCEVPICTRCAVYGPVGVRCRDCAKNRVPLRPRGLLHSAGTAVERNAGRTVWYLAIWYFLVSVVSNLFGGSDT